VGFREVGVVEIREVLRAWLQGAGLRTVASRAGVDRKTARRYVEAAQAAGLVRSADVSVIDDELVGAVVAAVRPVRPNGHGSAWESLLAREDQIRAWVSGTTGQGATSGSTGTAAKAGAGLSIVKIEELLARQGCVVPYRTLHRFATERCGYRPKRSTVRVNDGEPGVELQVDFGHLGWLVDPETGRRRKVHALIFTAVYSRHMFVWLTHAQTLAVVIAGCEAAWRFFGGVFTVLIRRQPDPGRHRRGGGEPAAVAGMVGLCPARGVRHRPREGPLAAGQAAGRADGAVRARQLLGRGELRRSG
jgi:hypothetical protein